MIEAKDISIDELKGMHREIAELIGVENMLKLCTVYGGAPLWIPSLASVTVAARNRDIINMRLAGSKTRDIAKKYDIHPKTVWEVLSGAGYRGRKPERVL